MKKFLLATVGLVALVSMAAPASAADMAVKAAPVPYVAPMYNWSGFYIGGNGGWGQSRNCWGIVPVAGAFIADGCADRSEKQDDVQPPGVWPPPNEMDDRQSLEYQAPRV